MLNNLLDENNDQDGMDMLNDMLNQNDDNKTLENSQPKE